MNYYVMQVSPHEEQRALDWIKSRVEPSLYGECFHLTRYVRKKFKGKWHDVYQKLLPGYVFIETEDIEGLWLALRKIPVMTKLLGRGGDPYTSLNESETEWLLQLKGANGEVALSFIRVHENNEVSILSGPLTGMKGMIKKINLHKRVAEVEVNLMNQKITVYLGIEIVKPATGDG